MDSCIHFWLTDRCPAQGWLDDAITGYLPLTTLKTNPNVFDPNAYKGAHNNPSSSDRDSIKDKGSGGSHPKERDTSHYAANLQYHKERAEREAEEKKKVIRLRCMNSGGGGTGERGSTKRGSPCPIHNHQCLGSGTLCF